MAGYCSARKLTNVKGRLDYISNPARQEYIEDYHNTADLDFWSLLATESQQQHKQQIQKRTVFKNGQKTEKIVKSKCIEAREFIVGIPQNENVTAKQIAEWFKATYGVECAVALHWKESTQNFHAHIIYSERELLPEPKIIEHKRTYYYNSDGKKCKKADAVKVVPKGIETRYFSDKRADFKTMGFAMTFKNTILDKFGLERFDYTRHFPTKHIGKNNPKAAEIEKYNTIVTDLNLYFDLCEEFYDCSKATPKKYFCKEKGSDKLYVPEIDEIAVLFAEFREKWYISPKMAQNRFESLSEALYEYNKDLEHSKTMYKRTSDVVQQDLNAIYRKEIPPKYDNLVGSKLIERIEYSINSIKNHIQWFVSTLKKFNISFDGIQKTQNRNYDEIEL